MLSVHTAPTSWQQVGPEQCAQLTSSQARGAKQLLVVTTHATCSGPSRCTAASMALVSVIKASPSCFSSITTGARFAAVMALRHVFWSMRLQMTWLHAHRVCTWNSVHAGEPCMLMPACDDQGASCKQR